ncbi:MAG: TIM barrel protein [Marinibacterium sp.]|nr:TIM barrel protein [Marinibacterium sp.]
MPRFAANISLLFSELPYLDRFDAAAEAGFKAVEILFPYDEPAKDTRRALIANGLELVLINAPPPNYTGGRPGYAAQPDMAERFRYDMRRVLRYCEALQPGKVHVMSGPAEGDAARACFVENLQYLADLAPKQQFTIEPLNPHDQPGYFLNDYGLAADILDAVDRPNLGLQYDCYHAARIHGDALQVWRDHGHRASHVQISMPPDRSAPAANGPVNFATLFAAMTDTGYDGWVSAEYHPKGRTAATLGWMRQFGG